ncbi:hypothetical protein [Myxosarcina sp. GI1(2024)]
MMGKNNTASQLDFLQFEEISNEAAEAISGGQDILLGGVQEVEFELGELPLLPLIAAQTTAETALDLFTGIPATAQDMLEPILGIVPAFGAIL